MKKIKDINTRCYNILITKLTKKFYCLSEFSRLFLENDDIIDLFLCDKKSPKQNDNILPVLIMFNEYVSFEATTKLKKNKENWGIIKANFFKLIQKYHEIILGIQIDGHYQILGIADENNFLCRTYSEIPIRFNNSIYFTENNVLLPINFLTAEFSFNCKCVYWDNQTINEFESDYLNAIEKGDGILDFSLS